ncbi:putative ribonuclease H-like domain-containing protein [Tanacetum coccineum]
MPNLEDDSDAFSSDDIFNEAYDDESVGAVADFNNMDDIINVSPILTLRIHKNHPKDQILRDHKLAVQTRGKIQKASSAQQALEEGIDYDDVFAPVARIEAIRLFLAFASYMGFTGFTVYQMDVKSTFLYGTIEKEVYVHQPPGFVDPAHPNKVYKERTATTPIESKNPLVKDEDGEDVDVHIYRSMIDSLMYLTASRPNIIDYEGASLDIKSTTGGCQFLGRILISWQCKKQTIMANSTTKAEYVVAANCCRQVLWIQNQMMDYGFNFMNTKIHIDNESTISVIKNPVAHSKTKHIEIRFHFIRDCYEKRLIEVIKIYTDSNVADLLTKGFDAQDLTFWAWDHVNTFIPIWSEVEKESSKPSERETSKTVEEEKVEEEDVKPELVLIEKKAVRIRRKTLARRRASDKQGQDSSNKQCCIILS